MDPIKLNLGAGNKRIPGYLNVDINPEDDPDILSDIRDLREHFQPNSVDEMMGIHIAEHFYVWDLQPMLKHWFDLIKPEGRLILECPNLLEACKRVVEDPLMNTTHHSPFALWCIYGDPAHKDELMCHHWGFTPESLIAELYRAGFRDNHQAPAEFKQREPRDFRVVGIKPGANHDPCE